MTTTLTPHATPLGDELTGGRLSGAARAAIAVVAVVAGIVITLGLSDTEWGSAPADVVTLDFKWGWALIVAATLYTVGIYGAASVVEDRRKAKDRLATALVTMAFILVMVPLISVVWTVVSKGSARLDWTFLTGTMRLTPEELASQNDGAAVGGALHAIIGTLEITALTAMFAIPFGIFTAIYLVEYGGGKFARAITSLVDVMTGIPSIVAGLFAYALFELILGPGTRSGLAGAVALTVLMTPVVVRSAEEMLRLVPDELREASYALGVPKWKTIAKVVLPTAIAGILTGVTLAIARVIGETAPLLITVGLAQGTNLNPADGRMTTLPVYAYYSYMQPGVPPEAGVDRSWAASLVLIIIVVVLFSAARLMATILKPKGLK